jgi:hypothetical protein
MDWFYHHLIFLVIVSVIDRWKRDWFVRSSWWKAGRSDSHNSDRRSDPTSQHCSGLVTEVGGCSTASFSTPPESSPTSVPCCRWERQAACGCLHWKCPSTHACYQGMCLTWYRQNWITVVYIKRTPNMLIYLREKYMYRCMMRDPWREKVVSSYCISYSFTLANALLVSHCIRH